MTSGTYQKDSTRAKQGHALEAWVLDHLLQRDLIASSTHDVFAMVYGHNLDAQLAKFNALPEKDCEYGDIHVFEKGKPRIHISVKSSSANTFSYSHEHLTSFAAQGSCMNFFIFAHVDGDGEPIGMPFMVNTWTFKELHDKYSHEKEKGKPEAGYFMGLQHPLFEAVVGINNICDELKRHLSFM